MSAGGSVGVRSGNASPMSDSVSGVGGVSGFGNITGNITGIGSITNTVSDMSNITNTVSGSGNISGTGKVSNGTGVPNIPGTVSVSGFPTTMPALTTPPAPTTMTHGVASTPTNPTHGVLTTVPDATSAATTPNGTIAPKGNGLPTTPTSLPSPPHLEIALPSEATTSGTTDPIKDILAEGVGRNTMVTRRLTKTCSTPL